MPIRLLFAVLLLCSGLARATEIRLGSLSLDWPAGYTLKSAQSPFELTGPGGSKVLVTVMRPAAAADSPEALARLNERIERLVTEQATRAGQIVLPLSVRTLPDGTRLQSIGSQATGLLQRGSYFLLYVLTSRQGVLALISFEGRGDALAEHDSLQGLFSSVQWTAGDGSPQEQMAFTERVAARLRAQLGAEAVRVADPLTLKIGELQANLDRINAFCRGNAAGCDAEVERYVQAVVEMQRKAALPPSREALRVVVRTADFVQGATTTGAAKGSFPRQTLVDGLYGLLMLDSPRSARLVSDADCQALGLTPDEAYALGRANLRRELRPLAQAAKPVALGAFGTLEGDFYESGRVLLHEDWAPLARAQKGALLVALPAKNLLIYSADDSPAGRDALRLLARDLMKRSPGPLSDLLLRWTPEGWQAAP